MTVALIIQARMGSTRLPGKVLLDLPNGHTVLEEVIGRCGAVPGIDVVCCAVPDDLTCDALAAKASSAGARVFRGSEHDVLSRYHGAAALLGAEHVMRVTSDCPLSDPKVYGEVLKVHRQTGADLTANDIVLSWPLGVACEVFTFSWLDRAHREATAPEDREHVSTYILNHSEANVVGLVRPGPSLGHYRWTLDTPADFKCIEFLISKLPKGPIGWDYRTALEIWAAEET